MFIDRVETLEAEIERFKAENAALRLQLEESRKSEQALRESESHSRMMLENTTDMLSIYTPAGKCVYVSPAIRVLLGYEPEELLECSGFEFFHPDDLENIQTSYKAALEYKQSSNFIYRIRRKDGIYIWFETTIRAIRDGDTNEITRMICTSRDISSRLQVMDALTHVQHFVKGITDALPDVLYIFDLVQNRIIYSNQVLSRILSFTPEEIAEMGKNLTMLLCHPDDRAALAESREKIRKDRDGEIIATEFRLKAKNGEWRWMYRNMVVSLRDENGNPIQFLATARDMTEHRRIGDKLRESQHFAQLVTDAVPDILYVFDLHETTNVFTNDGYSRLLGYSPEEIEEFGSGFISSLFHPDDLAAHRKSWYNNLSALQDKETFTFEYRLKAKDGTWRWIWDRAAVFARNPDGSPRQSIGVAQDITSQRLAQYALADLLDTLEARVAARTEELETANRALRNAEQVLRQAHDDLERRVEERTADLNAAVEELKMFAYIISHDLRAPLVNMKGFSHELKLTLDNIRDLIAKVLPNFERDVQTSLQNALYKDAPEFIEYINAAVSRIDRLTTAILKLSRLGRRELLFELLDMKALMQRCLNSLNHQIKQGGVKVTVVGPLPELIADHTSIEQIVGNILSNAINYLVSERPGEIVISAECDTNKTTFHIHDNGRGIAPENIAKVFEPFRRLEPMNVPGEGMGLAYVQMLVRRHGGQIWCTSEAGVGTTFSFSIALSPAHNDGV